MNLMQQAKQHVKEAVQELHLKIKAKFDLITKVKIELREDVKMNTNGFANRLIALSNKIHHLERARVTSSSDPEITDGFGNDLSTL